MSVWEEKKDKVSLAKGGREGEEKRWKESRKRLHMGKKVQHTRSTEPRGAFSDMRRTCSSGK